MAIGVIVDAVGVSQAQYEQVHNEVAPGNRAVPGLLYHAAGPTEGGFCVVEIWESEEVLGRFVQEKLGAALQRANITTQPKMFQIVNTMQP